jgi:hypothetical protein
MDGGGVIDSILYNCIVLNNTSTIGEGGGASHCTLYNCAILNNTGQSGGGVDDCTLYNCEIISNTSDEGGGAYICTLYNCTIADNVASFNGGGAFESTLYNCVSWGNSIADEALFAAYFSCGAGTQYTNTLHGCTTNDPLLDASYKLQAGSPCINTGTNGAWTTGATDLDGNKRTWPYGGTVDMGAYEYGSKVSYSVWMLGGTGWTTVGGTGWTATRGSVP